MPRRASRSEPQETARRPHVPPEGLAQPASLSRASAASGCRGMDLPKPHDCLLGDLKVRGMNGSVTCTAPRLQPGLRDQNERKERVSSPEQATLADGAAELGKELDPEPLRLLSPEGGSLGPDGAAAVPRSSLQAC